MTWGEFKAAIAAQGVKDDDLIDAIDWGFGRFTSEPDPPRAKQIKETTDGAARWFIQ